MKIIRYGVVTLLLGFASTAAHADAGLSMSCGIHLLHKATGEVEKAEFAVSKSAFEEKDSWATAVFLGKAPEVITIGLSATIESPDLLVAEIALGRQPEMAEGPGHAAAGSVLETTRVHIDGQVQLIFDVPKIGIEVVCDPFGI
jgi:hypothetical protein